MRQVEKSDKVLMVINYLRGGGAERQLTQMAAYWASTGVTVTVATFTHPENAADFYTLPDGVRRIHLRSDLNFRKIPHSIANLASTIRGVDPDVVLSFSEACNFITWISSIICNKRCCLSVRANPCKTFSTLSFSWRLLVLMAYHFCDTLVVQTKGAAEWLERKAHKTALVIPNPLRAMKLPQAKRRKIIIAVGSLIEKKGHSILLKAFASIHELHPEWRLVILGEGPLRQDISEAADALSIRSKLELPGLVCNIEDWLEISSVFVLPSRQEGFPNALIEAMAMGLACISTDCKYGPEEIIINGLNGLLVPVDDDVAMASAISHLVTNPDYRCKLGQSAINIRSSLEEIKIMKQWSRIVLKSEDEA